MKKPLISIVIPCYNCAQTIEQCLLSIINNDIQDFECILINDASTDDTLEKIQLLTKSYTNFIIINNDTNKGVSYSRNMGLNIAKGEWISFIDADDYIAPDRYTRALEHQDYDMIRSCEKIMSDAMYNGVSLCPLYQFESGEFKDEVFNTVSVSKVTSVLYKKELIGNIRFRDCDFAEDVIFNMECFAKCRKIYSVGEPESYYYVKQVNGLSDIQQIEQTRIDKVVSAFHEMLLTIKDDKLQQLFISNMKRRRVIGEHV